MDLPLHPKLVHLPIALAILMPLVSGGLLVAWWRGWLQRRTWAIAVALQAVLVASGVAALRSGEADEERVEAVVAEAAIEAHEEAADVFIIGSIAALVLLLGAALPGRASKVAALVGTVGTAGVLALGVRVGHLGGKIVYQEGGAAAWTDRQWQLPPEGKDDDHD